jgi:hypothetical protein
LHSVTWIEYVVFAARYVAGTANSCVAELFAARYLWMGTATEEGPLRTRTSKLTLPQGRPAAPVEAVTSILSGLQLLIVDAMDIAATGVVGVPGAATAITELGTLLQDVQFCAAWTIGSQNARSVPCLRVIWDSTPSTSFGALLMYLGVIDALEVSVHTHRAFATPAN